MSPVRLSRHTTDVMATVRDIFMTLIGYRTLNATSPQDVDDHDPPQIPFIYYLSIAIHSWEYIVEWFLDAFSTVWHMGFSFFWTGCYPRLGNPVYSTIKPIIKDRIRRDMFMLFPRAFVPKWTPGFWTHFADYTLRADNRYITSKLCIKQVLIPHKLNNLLSKDLLLEILNKFTRSLKLHEYISLSLRFLLISLFIQRRL